LSDKILVIEELGMNDSQSVVAKSLGYCSHKFHAITKQKTSILLLITTMQILFTKEL